MDTSKQKDEQTAKFLAVLCCDIRDTRKQCTPEDLSSACLAFPVTPVEIRRLCTLPDVPLELINGRTVHVSNSFKLFVEKSFVSLLQNQTEAAKHVLVPPPGKEDCKIVKLGLKAELTVVRSNFDCVNAVKQEPAVSEIPPQIENSTVLLPTGNGLATNDSIGYIHEEKPSNPPLRTESHLSPYDGNPSNPMQRIEKSHLATPAENISKPLQRTEKTQLVAYVENPSHPLQRTEKSHLTTAAAYFFEQGLVPLANEINAQPKKKSRDPRSAPRFEDYAVDGEVGAGGYGTVYKVRRKADGQVFAVKCPLENTHDSCVRNEINMLKRLRGKDNIIQLKSEVTAKVSPKPEAAGGEDIDCPSILLEFIEHDKPEVLKKEITIEELKYYSSSLFKALAQLHKERILHLDVKPGNFLFSRSTKRGCLVDFNLAREESAKRLSTRRPERGPSRAWNNEVKTSERKKRSLAHEDTARNLSKRSRKIMEVYPELPQLGTPPTNGTCIGDQSKETLRPAASKDVPVASPKYHQPQSRANSATGAITASNKHAEPLKVNDRHDDIGIAQQLGRPKTQQTVLRGSKPLAVNHRLAQFMKDNGVVIPSCPSTPPFTQATGVPAFKRNPNKRVPAGVLPHFQAVAQLSSIKRVKPAPKVKVPCQPVKDGPCVGTKGYRAPEVLMRSTKQTTKVDIWSAGVSLLQLVTGRSPFPSTSTDGALKDIAKLKGSTTMDKLAKSLGQRPRFIKDPYQGMPVKEWSETHSRRTDLKGRVPSTLYDLIERCLDVNPESRITAEAALQHQFCSIETYTSEFSKHPNPS